MKKSVLLATIVTCACGIQAAAQMPYLKIGTGYSFAMPGQTADLFGGVIDGTIQTSSSTPTSTTYKLKSASFSSGLQAQIGAGYLFTKNIGIELSAQMNITTKNYTALHTGLVNSSKNNYDYKIERKANNLIVVTPALILQTSNTNFNLYMKMGVAVPFNSGMRMTQTFIYPNSFQTNKYTWDVENYTTLGMSATCGVKFRLDKRVTLWCETNMLYMALYAKTAKMKAANLNGKNVAPSSLSGGHTTYHFVKNATDNGNGTEQTYSQPYSNIGISAGLSFRL